MKIDKEDKDWIIGMIDSAIEEAKNDFWEEMQMHARKNSDLDSIEFGAPAKGGRVKIYLDTRSMATGGQGQIDAAMEALDYLKKEMEEEK